MIKDRITQELKNRMLQDIKETIKDEKEHGFLICVDNKGNLSPTESCKGEKCEIQLASFVDQCPHKIQGDFHTHNHMAEIRRHVEKIPGRKFSYESFKKVIIEHTKKKNETSTVPSHGDTISAIGSKYNDMTLGTVCIGADLDENNVECWTAKDNITREDFERAERELSEHNTGIPIREWVKPLFDKEIISLR